MGAGGSELRLGLSAFIGQSVKFTGQGFDPLFESLRLASSNRVPLTSRSKIANNLNEVERTVVDEVCECTDIVRQRRHLCQLFVGHGDFTTFAQQLLF